MDNDIQQLKKVVEGGFCVGCGACAFSTSGKMSINSYGEYVPDIDNFDSNKNPIEDLTLVCPSLRPDFNEDILSEHFLKDCSERDSHIGFVQKTYAAYALEGEFREKGTSGGMGSWIATELLQKGLIDGVIHVKPVNRISPSDPFFEYGLSTSVEEIQAASKTRYHVVEVSKVLSLINNTNGRFLFIGVPCIAKAIRRLQIARPELKDKIPFVIALVCGHLKSINWSLSLAWGGGIPPENASSIQYRTKGSDIPARAYVFRAKSNTNQYVQKDSASVPGGKFNAGALMLTACDFCDDVVGEIADLTIGDAWIPRFEVDNQGTNLLIVRNTIIHDLLKSANSSQRIKLDEISNKEAIDSQSGGFRQRREGLSYRLSREIALGKWVPEKRITPGQFKISSFRKKLYDQRSFVTIKSRDLFKEALAINDYSIYLSGMTPITTKLRKMEIMSSFFRLFMNKIKRIYLGILK